MIAEAKGWSLPLMASAFLLLAATRIVATLGIGEAIDRLSARLLLPLTVLPLAFAMALLWMPGAIWLPYAFMALLGSSLGMAGAVAASSGQLRLHPRKRPVGINY